MADNPVRRRTRRAAERIERAAPQSPCDSDPEGCPGSATAGADTTRAARTRIPRPAASELAR
jgi:hypothetical protein